MRSSNVGAAASFLSLFVSCSMSFEAHHYEEDRRLSEEAVQLLHQRLDEERYDEIYESADDSLRRLWPKEAFTSQMRTTHEQLGRLVSSEQKAATCFPGEVRLIYHARFANGDATEMFKWGFQHGHPALAHFQIHPGLGEIPEVAGHECRSEGQTKE